MALRVFFSTWLTARKTRNYHSSRTCRSTKLTKLCSTWRALRVCFFLLLASLPFPPQGPGPRTNKKYRESPFNLSQGWDRKRERVRAATDFLTFPPWDVFSPKLFGLDDPSARGCHTTNHSAISKLPMAHTAFRFTGSCEGDDIICLSLLDNLELTIRNCDFLW